MIETDTDITIQDGRMRGIDTSMTEIDTEEIEGWTLEILITIGREIGGTIETEIGTERKETIGIIETIGKIEI